MKSITLDSKDIARFWSKVNVKGFDECWEWTAHRNNKGYGILGLQRDTFLATRVSWTIENGKIPDGMEILHSCDNPGCVNPKHLKSGTHKENIEDMFSKGRNKKGFIHRGEGHKLSKLSEKDIPIIRKLFDEGISTHVIGKRFGVNSKTIWFIGKRIAWSHVE